MAIEIKFTGKDDRAGKCTVVVGGVIKLMRDGAEGFIDALMALDEFKEFLSEKDPLQATFEEMVEKAANEVVLVLMDVPSHPGAGGSGLKRYSAYIDGELVYEGNSARDFGIAVNNIVKTKMGP